MATICITSVSGASHYIKCVTPIGSHRQPPAYTHTAKKVSQPSAMLRNSQVAKSRRKIPEITCFIVLVLFCKLSLAKLLSPVATQWWYICWCHGNNSGQWFLGLLFCPSSFPCTPAYIRKPGG